MLIVLIMVGLIFCGASVFFFYKANYCACTQAGQCDNPVNRYWLGAMLNAVVSLIFCCTALHVELGTLLWLVLMGSCFLGAFISAQANQKRQCIKAKREDDLLTNEIS
ncbi:MULTISPECIES: hypothetical protein [Pseudoalteromonas]|uniref:hypothetical protein n=1 Tax=Pseudoalteromonas TaxID=53246 RepID=UPI0009DDF4DD|nr:MULTISPECIES: hypothetical protein [Pseudoalteromonas]ATG57293.1 hypothetical protein CPA52_03130 [Pseudoalteromonas marina]TMS80678.1 hypothetical protein CWB65_14200 [Pseudoalteromonas sp. S554]